jgi:hypothetical protein
MSALQRHEDMMAVSPLSPWRRLAAAALSSVLLSAGIIGSGHADGATGKSFASPEQATDALAAAWHSGRGAELRAIFGPAGVPLINSGDPVAEMQAHERLAAAWDAGHRIEREGRGKAVLVLGEDQWPYPIPLVRQGAMWRFDVEDGARQILDRRIGRNELNAIETCRLYVEAQRDYAAEDRLVKGLREYAQKIASGDGAHDGLYWPASGDAVESPLGPFVAAAEARGYDLASAEGLAPFQGYFYRVLTRQGAHAPGGSRSYLVDGHMTGGFALIAFPAKYGNSGVMSFIVDQHGVVFEKNLGPNTSAIAGRITAFDPDKSWKAVAP